MKKFLLILLLLPTLASAQWLNLGTGTWQITADGKLVSTTFGSNGRKIWYQKSQVDSLRALYLKLGANFPQVQTTTLTAVSNTKGVDFSSNVSVGADGITVYAYHFKNIGTVGVHTSSLWTVGFDGPVIFNGANVAFSTSLSTPYVSIPNDVNTLAHHFMAVRDTAKHNIWKFYSKTGNFIAANFDTVARDILNKRFWIRANGMRLDSVATTGGLSAMAMDTNNDLVKSGIAINVKAVGPQTLVSGTKTFSVTGATSSSMVQGVTVAAIGGTVTTTWQYVGTCTTGSCTITAKKTDGTTNTLDTSTLNFIILN
jgi:hypothetical protein